MSLPTYPTLLTTMVEPHVLLVTLNRPEVGNAINTQAGRDLLDLWNRLTEEAGDVRCVVLTGAGDRIFCAGGDLKERNGMTREQWVRQHELFERMYWTMADLPVPVIAAVNGHAYAGGFELMLNCDFALASDAARFALTEVTLGIMPGAGGTQNLPRAIGDQGARMGHRQPTVRAVHAAPAGAPDRADDCRQCTAVGQADQEVGALRRPDGDSHRVPFRDRSLQPLG